MLAWERWALLYVSHACSLLLNLDFYVECTIFSRWFFFFSYSASSLLRASNRTTPSCHASYIYWLVHETWSQQNALYTNDPACISALICCWRRRKLKKYPSTWLLLMQLWNVELPAWEALTMVKMLLTWCKQCLITVKW